MSDHPNVYLFYRLIYVLVVEKNAEAKAEGDKPMSLATNTMLYALEDSQRRIKQSLQKNCQSGDP